MNVPDSWRRLPSGLVVRAWVAVGMVPPEQRERLVKTVAEVVGKLAPAIALEALCHERCASEGRCVVREQRERASWN